MAFSLRERRGGTRWLTLIGILTITYTMRFAFLGCSPYPVYNQSQVARENPENTDERAGVNPSDQGSSPIASIDDEACADLPAASVEPGIFDRVVRDYLGIPYKLGGDDTDGIDCSSLVRNLFRDYDGIRLPASTKELYALPHRVPPDALAFGDLVFFRFSGSGVSHVGVYLGSDKFVHASESQGVIISSLRDAPYRDRYAGARRAM